MKLFFLALACCFLNSCVFSQDDPQSIANQIEQVENSLAGRIKFEGVSGANIFDRMELFKVRGLSIAVIRNYQVVWAKGYGWADVAMKQPVTTKTLFQAASVSKPVNSMGVMKLVQEHKLDLKRDINEYLVSWKFPYDRISNGKKITTMNLLTHTGGINEGGSGYTDKDSIPGIIQVLNGTKGSAYIYADTQAVHSISEPDHQFQYSNNGVGLTQVIISDITGKTYEQFMRETVFDPLGMTHSCYEETTLKKYSGQYATGYTNGYEIPGKHVITPMQAAGGLWTTPADLAKFIIEIQESYAGKSEKVLTKQTVHLMLTPYIQEPPGFFIRQPKSGGQKYFGHSGSKPGFRCEFVAGMEGGDGVVVMTNEGGGDGSIIQEVINSVASVYHWKDFYDPEIRKKPIAVSEDLLNKCEGVYLFEDKYAVVLKKKDGGHYWADGIEANMYFTDSVSFFNIEFSTNKRVQLDKQGNVSGIRRFLDGVEVSAARKVKDISSENLPLQQLSAIAWYLLENKKIDMALSYYRRCNALFPQDVMTTCNLAHCYLFSGQYDRAIDLYRKNMNEKMGSVSFRQTVLDDFCFFKGNGFDETAMEKAVEDLKLNSKN